MTTPLLNLCAGNGATAALAEHVERLEREHSKLVTVVEIQKCKLEQQEQSLDGLRKLVEAAIDKRVSAPTADAIERQLAEARAECERRFDVCRWARSLREATHAGDRESASYAQHMLFKAIEQMDSAYCDEVAGKLSGEG